MRVLVCGGRDFADHDLLAGALAAMHAATPLKVLIPGDAKGADRLAGEWAEAVGIPAEACPVDWKRYRAAAGRKRNARLLAQGKSDLVVAFPGDCGASDLVAMAAADGVRVVTVSAGRETT